MPGDYRRIIPGDEKNGTIIRTGRRATMKSSTFCDIMSEFLYHVAMTVIHKYSGYQEYEFHNAGFGPVMQVKESLDDEVVEYCTNTVKVARNAMKREKLEAFRVSIVDASDVVQVAFQVNFRQQQKFYDAQRKVTDLEHRKLQQSLSMQLFKLQMCTLPEAVLNIIHSTETRPRVELKLHEDVSTPLEKSDPKCKKLQASKTTPLSWGDSLANFFNEMSFSGFHINKTDSGG